MSGEYSCLLFTLKDSVAEPAECRNCVLHGRLLSLTQDPESVKYRVTWPSKFTPGSSDDTEALLKHYFSLKYDLGALYAQWSRDDANFRKKAPKFTGIRILSQDAWEALVSFICSSNNNISRICQMVCLTGIIVSSTQLMANIPRD